MIEMRIRECTLEDLEKVRMISMETFLETFSKENTPEDMEKYVKDNFSLEKLKEEMACVHSIFLLVERENEVLAYLKLNFREAQTEMGHDEALEIQRIYVLEKFKNMKIGQMLVRKTLELAAKKNLSYIWLGVWEKNEKAIRFYEKLGFEKFDTHVFVLGEDEQTDHLMMLNVVGGLGETD